MTGYDCVECGRERTTVLIAPDYEMVKRLIVFVVVPGPPQWMTYWKYATGEMRAAAERFTTVRQTIVEGVHTRIGQRI